MTRIIDATIAARRGGVVRLREFEPDHEPTTKPHLPGTGLRGHSVDDDSYPWRVVGTGDGLWEVHDARGQCHHRCGLYLAHARARQLKALHPRGFIECDENGVPRNISGDIETIPARLAGSTVTVQYRDDPVVTYRVEGPHPEFPRLIKAVDMTANRIVSLSASLLAHDARYKVEIGLSKFYRG